MSETARRLAAILAVDVAGYSRLMGEDEAGTAKAVREHREAARPIVASHGGRIVKTMGDGVLLEFPSVVAAVECAIAVQKLMVERNGDVPDDKRVIYRIGINLGDVLIEGEDILGDGVNIAARLEGIAEPGGICLSGTAYEHVRDKIAAEFVDLGDRELKNIARPVRAYAIAAPSRPYTSTMPGEGHRAMAEKAAPPRLSIVVLPFANIGGDPEQEYFVDGVTESLTTDLSRISGSFVIARNTAFTYKGKPIDVKQVGRELNVRYVLEGSVQRGGNRLRVNVQLIDAETGNHLWAERFDKPLADLFDMQDEIVARLANQLNAQFIEIEARRAERAPNPDSMDLYFQGMAYWHGGMTPDYVVPARDLFRRALTLDAANIDAMVALAYLDATGEAARMTDNSSEILARSEASLIRATSMAPHHAFGHCGLASVYCSTKRAAQGLAEAEHAMTLDRNLASGHAIVGRAKLLLGRAEESDNHIVEALRLSPRDRFAYFWMNVAGFADLLVGRNEDAVRWLRLAIHTNPNLANHHYWLSAALVRLGHLEDARSAARMGKTLNPDFIRRFRGNRWSDNPSFLAQMEQVYENLRQIGVPEE